jgi:KDO2-lipid IV(A) lauroyltransferase
MRMKHLVEYILFTGVSLLVRAMPLRILPKVAGVVVTLASPLLLSRKRVALRNLRNAFPEKSRRELERISRESFVSVAIAFLELLWFPRLSKEQMLKKVTVENPDVFAEAVARGKGVICMTAHFGNWELAGQTAAAAVDVPSYIIVKTQSNKLVDKKINAWRTKFGASVVPMGIAIREIVRALQKGGAVLLAADQTAPKESIAIEFFGRSVPTFQGPAIFSLRTGAALVLIMLVRQPDGNYRLLSEIIPSEDLKGCSDENVFELTRRQVKMTEEIIRKYPGQWMWMHKRWKHVPDRVGLSQ